MRLRLIVTLLAGLIVIGGASSRAIAQDTASQSQQDRAEAAAAGRDILALAGERNFNAMYDLMHPDSKAVVPRAAAIGTFSDAYGQAQAGTPEIVSVDLVPYTWGVTGKTYQNAARVTFVQPVIDANGNQTFVEDTLYLAEDGNGNWGWFFGSSPEMVQSAIATYGTSNESAAGTDTLPTTPLTQGDLLVNTVNDLDAFWREVLGYTDFEYQSPGVVIVADGDSVMSACGPASTGFWGFYCPLDQKMYLDEKLLVQLADQGMSFAAAFVIAHEWAHHVQTGIGLDRTSSPDEWNEVHSIELELMADCLSGVWARDATGRGVIAPGDIEQAATFAVQALGDPEYIEEYDEQAHGNSNQRVSAIMGGYDEGFLACNLLI